MHTYNVYVPSIAEIIFEALWLFGILSFAISGALVGVRKNLDLLGVLVVGTATGIGGGVVRDVLVTDVPGVLTRELYAVSAIVGATIATVIVVTSSEVVVASVVGGVVAVTLRLVSYKFGWHLPKPKIVTD